MSGSLAHITDENGNFTMELIETMGDAHEALEECFNIIQELALAVVDENPGRYFEERKRLVISEACKSYNYPDPYEKLVEPLL
jgi:hypothetical protein